MIRIGDNELHQKFKSILKKTSERTPSPLLEKPGGGSQFYIPLPNMKKKVQFLVSNDMDSSTEEIPEKGFESDDNDVDDNDADDDVFEESFKDVRPEAEPVKVIEEPLVTGNFY